MRVLVPLCLLLLPLAARAQLLGIESLDGPAQFTHDGKLLPAAVGAVLQSDDALALGADTRATLQLGRHGLLELGPGAQVAVERLPFASFADDLRTVIRLRRGYLRVIWKQPPLDINWPLFVYLDDHSASLTTGEYFFDKSASRVTICVAEGQLALAGAGSAEPQLFGADVCMGIGGAQVSQPVARSADDWIGVRQARMLASALIETPPVAEAPPNPAPAPAAVAAPKPPARIKTKPAIATAAKAQAAPSMPAPTKTAAGSWTLNLASFADRPSAQTQADRARKAGFAAVVAEAEVKGHTWYRVQLPGLASQQQAQALKDRVKAIGFAQAWALRPGG